MQRTQRLRTTRGRIEIRQREKRGSSCVPTGCLTTMLRRLGTAEGICSSEAYIRKQKGNRGEQGIPPYVRTASSAMVVPPVSSVVQPKNGQGTHRTTMKECRRNEFMRTQFQYAHLEERRAIVVLALYANAISLPDPHSSRAGTHKCLCKRLSVFQSLDPTFSSASHAHPRLRSQSTA